jgi:hypothetical protein
MSALTSQAGAGRAARFMVVAMAVVVLVVVVGHMQQQEQQRLWRREVSRG